ncbi:MAG: adenylate/guanylate cyclase domain-containing protein [Candidatus Baltobacteraceae bacterium]
MDKRWRALSRRPFQVTIGVNSGNVVAGEVGFAQRREFGIVGNPAQVAAQLQHAAEELNASILSSATTFEAASDLFVGVPARTSCADWPGALRKSCCICRLRFPHWKR